MGKRARRLKLVRARVLLDHLCLSLSIIPILKHENKSEKVMRREIARKGAEKEKEGCEERFPWAAVRDRDEM